MNERKQGIGRKKGSRERRKGEQEGMFQNKEREEEGGKGDREW